MRAGAPISIDPRALSELRRESRAAPGQGAQEAARQFEALFLRMMVKSMREAVPRSGLMDGGDAMRTYEGMMDDQLAQTLSRRGIGLAAVIERQLLRSPKPAAEARPAAPIEAAPPPGAMLPAGQLQREFVARFKPAAEAAARDSGVPAAFVLGQAALESGWGRREIRHADGSPSHNLFGIKAGPGWRGRTVETLTTEYMNGVPRRQVERFRAYGSYAEAFADWSRLVGGTPRYAAAARAAADPGDFARSIARAGYATDPDYARKLESVIRRTLDVVAGGLPQRPA